MEGRDFLAKDYTPREYLVAARDRCDYSIEKIRAIVTPRFKYLRNYLTDRPFMQPSYKDPWPVSIRFREMMANNEMNETQLIFFGPEKPAEEPAAPAPEEKKVEPKKQDSKEAGSTQVSKQGRHIDY